MSEYKQTTNQIENLIEDVIKRQSMLREMILKKNITKEAFESDLSWHVYENTKLAAIGLLDVRKMLKTSEYIAVIALAASTVAIVLSIVLS